MLGSTVRGLNRRRLRVLLAGFFLALAIPTAVLIYHAYDQLKWEAFHQHRILAEELAARIDGHLADIVAAEEARSFTDYAFLVVEGDESANFVQRSALAKLPLPTQVPGLLGYFQVDANGVFSTPLLPADGSTARSFGISAAEQGERLALQGRVLEVLSKNQLVASGQRIGSAAVDTTTVQGEPRSDYGDDATPAAASAIEQVLAPVDEFRDQGQVAFDKLTARTRARKDALAGRSLGQVADLELDATYSDRRRTQSEQPQYKAAPAAKRESRKERSALPETSADADMNSESAGTPSRAIARLRSFESELDPFEVGLLDSGHFVLFRKVFRDGQRYIQGLLIEQQALLREVFEAEFRETSLSRMSDLAVAFEGQVLAAFCGQSARTYPAATNALGGVLLHQASLSAPFNEVELLLSITRLPAGPGGRVITWVATILALVLCGGLALMYRLGVRQIELALQQQDFVSAVSHELRTPLTSIRMYGEMLREGWAPEEKKPAYYEFIFQESERLSRLIANVLTLARMTRNEVEVELKPLTLAELSDEIRSKVASQVERAGFELAINCPPELATTVVHADPDCFSQIAINLVDNALKFSATAATKIIRVDWTQPSSNSVRLAVRDYGPGVSKDQVRKIFRLFYRAENELTRETVGTGIGLALVRQLARSMGATVEVRNHDPGAEFQVTFRLSKR